MFDLKTRVHLHEIETAVLIRDELDGPRSDIADRLRGVHGRLSHRGPSLQRHAGCGRFLDQLLMPALNGAVALEQVDAVAVRVAEHLDLDVTRLQYVFLDQNLFVAEGVGSFTLARGECGFEI